MLKSISREKKYDILSIIFIFCTAFLFLTKCPTFFLRPGDTSVDTAVFQTVGYMMKRGFLPYVDSFDHKGVLLYFIHYLGSLINTNWGVSVFQLINLFITFYYAYKIARFKCRRLESIFIVLLASIILINNHVEPANVEEFSMGFVAVSLYIFLDYLLNNKTSNFKIFITGLCCGAVACIKVSQVSCWLVFCLAIFIDSIINKRFDELKRFILYFLCGFVLVVGFCIVWMAIKGCLSECIYDYIIFNFKYVNKRRNLPVSFNRWLPYDFILLAITICFFFISKKNKINIIYGIYLISCFLFIACLEDGSAHHGLTLFPAVIYPFSLVMESLDKEVNVKRLLIIVLMAYLVIPKWYTVAKSLPYKIIHYKEVGIGGGLYEICELIKKNTNRDDRISVYGNWDVVYLFSDRAHATKYSFQYPIRNCDDKIMKEYIAQLYQEKPKIVVLQSGNWGKYEGEIKKFIEDENYELIYPANGSVDSDGAKVFKIK